MRQLMALPDKNMIDFRNKTAVVTGAGSSKGIGYAACVALSGAGARVIALDVAFDHDCNGVWEQVTCDVTDVDRCVSVFDQITKSHRMVNILVNSAGIVSPTRIADLTADEFTRMLAINTTGVFNITQAALGLLKVHGGAIVNVASIAAQRGGGLLGGSHYAASKGAVVSFTKACAREFGAHGIRANCINPGIIDTGMTEGKYPPERLDMLLPQIPLGRLGLAKEVAGAIAFLASDMASYVTGIELDVNGGYHIH